MPDWLRLALGTLTVFRVPAPRVVNSHVAARAILAAPFVGVMVAIPAALIVWIIPTVSGLSATSSSVAIAALAAVLALTAIAALTRGLHLDGLADTADGLGSGRNGADALAVMSKSDIGPFGVVTLVLVLLIDVTSLTVCITAGRGVLALVVAVVLSRAGLSLACRRGVPAARSTGLGATVAESVTPAAAVAVVAVVIILSVAAAYATGGNGLAIACLLAGLGGLLGGLACLRRCRARFGGVTGDVLGAIVETIMCVALVIFAVTA